MKKLIVTLLFLSSVSWACANSPCPTGPQGPAGKNGSNGVNGTNGINGKDGAVGVAGAPGSDASIDNTIQVNVGAGVQWHEWDNHLSLNSGYRYDIHHGGHTIDALIVGYRFGKSAEDRRIDELKKQIESLRAAIPAPVISVDDKPVQTTIRGAK